LLVVLKEDTLLLALEEEQDRRSLKTRWLD